MLLTGEVPLSYWGVIYVHGLHVLGSETAHRPWGGPLLSRLAPNFEGFVLRGTSPVKTQPPRTLQDLLDQKETPC